MELARLNAIVTGIVQGVGYRFFVERLASNLNITGYVRNLPSGAVEVVAEGEKSKLLELIAYLREGPSSANVDNVEVSWSDAKGDFLGFTIRR